MTRPAPPADLDASAERALAEDVGAGDVTAQLVDASAQACARVIAREAAVLCGQPWFERVYARIDPRVEVRWDLEEGGLMRAEQRVAMVRGPARAVVTG